MRVPYRIPTTVFRSPNCVQEAVMFQINRGSAAVDGIYFMKLP